MRHLALAASAACALALASCNDREEPDPGPPATGHTAFFQDYTANTGIDFVHFNGASPRKYLPEIMGAGGAVLDYDGDGWMDLYLVQSGYLPGSETEVDAGGNRLFRNRGDGTLEDVTEGS